jgi:aspartyl/asparaginyl beta-hydroxylase (cupin superfamily)
MTSTLLFPFRFDAVRLKSDFDAIQSDDWVRHFNTAIFEGDWSAVPLRSIGGAMGQIFPDPEARNFEATEILRRCPYFQEVLKAFDCPLLAARLLRLKAGSVIREHTDYKLAYEDGELRVHIPVYTNDHVEFYVAGQRVILAEGECWYVNTSLPHRVANRGDADRIHLVIDCEVNDWLRTFFQAEVAAGHVPASV